MLEGIDEVDTIFDTMLNLFDPRKGGRPPFPYALKKKISDGTLVIEIAVTGSAPSDLSIKAKDNVLTISTISTTTPDTSDYTVYYDYIKRPNFSIPFGFPCEYDVSSASAKVEIGLCIITIPKKANADETDIVIS